MLSPFVYLLFYDTYSSLLTNFSASFPKFSV